MDSGQRIEDTLATAIESRCGDSTPPGLAGALNYAVFPGGHRIRPRICLAVAAACGDDEPRLVNAAAAAIEFLHCASLVHDDLPCFDDAPIRRGKPSVHAAFGEQLALLCGDALIVLAFQTLGGAAVAGCPDRLPALLDVLGRSVGLPFGIVAGQAWESEPGVPLDRYQRAKTGALFAAATAAGAAAAGAAHEPWAELGERLGLAYQVADDLLDCSGDVETLGKPVGRDAALARPNAVTRLGEQRAKARLNDLVEAAVGAVPDCPGRTGLVSVIAREARQFVAEALRRPVAA